MHKPEVGLVKTRKPWPPAALLCWAFGRACHAACTAYIGVGLGTMETHLQLHVYMSAGCLSLPHSK